MDEIEMKARKILFELGMPEHLSGHQMNIDAIRMVYDDPSIVTKKRVTTYLYPEIAKLHGRTKCGAERCIRHAIEVCYERADYETLQKYFGSTVSVNKDKPTCSEFISRIANIIRFWL